MTHLRPHPESSFWLPAEAFVIIPVIAAF